MRSRSTLLLVALLMMPGAAAAQDELPPGHPPIDGNGGGPDGDEDPHAGGRRLPGMGQQQSFDATEPAPDLPRGTLVVKVVDAEGQPVRDARVEVGMLRQGQSDRRVGKSNASGEARWDGLPAGPDRAVRVIVTNGPARFPAMPFAMSGDTGYRVTVTRWGVTESTDTLLLFIIRTFLEFAEEGDRLKVTQHLRLMNVGQDAIAPEEGIPIPVPAGMTAFRTEQGMGDQRVVERDGQLFVEGSLAPGEAQLAYGFDLHLDGSEFVFEQRLPFRVILAEVYAERAPGMSMNVTGHRYARAPGDGARGAYVPDGPHRAAPAVARLSQVEGLASRPARPRSRSLDRARARRPRDGPWARRLPRRRGPPSGGARGHRRREGATARRGRAHRGAAREGQARRKPVRARAREEPDAPRRDLAPGELAAWVRNPHPTPLPRPAGEGALIPPRSSTSIA
jgi:hypothetical protein